MEVYLPVYEEETDLTSSEEDNEEDDCAILPSPSHSVYDADDQSIVTDNDNDSIQVIDTTNSFKSPRKSILLPEYIGNSTFGSRYLDSLDLHDSGIISPRSGRTSNSVEILSPGLQHKSLESDPDVIKPPHVPKKPRIVKPPSERLLARREFHRKLFVRFRYPAQFHQDSTKKQKQPSYFHVPQSFQPKTRYGKEPKVQVGNTRKKPQHNWPKYPLYPPKARHTGTICEIIRMAETLDIGTQSCPQTSEAKVQCHPKCTNTSTQYVIPKTINTGVQTEEAQYQDAAIQNVPIMKNKMEETSVRILYFPEVHTQHNCTQTELANCQEMTEKVKDNIKDVKDLKEVPSQSEVECQTECILPIVTVDNPDGVCSMIETFVK